MQGEVQRAEEKRPSVQGWGPGGEQEDQNTGRPPLKHVGEESWLVPCLLLCLEAL